MFIMLPEELVLETAQEVGAKWIIAAHNHPYSSKDPKPGLGPFEYIFTTDVEEKRRSKIRDFSAADKESADAYAEYLSKHGIGHGEIVFVTGKWKHNLPDELEQHYQQVVPQGCLVALLAVPIAS